MKALRATSAQLLCAPTLDAEIGRYVDRSTHVIVAYPPDDATDKAVAPALAGAHSIAYISSTGVYGSLRGVVDDDTQPPAPPNERAQRLLRAEAHYQAQGAVVLRAAAIYGPDRGLHMRVRRGEHKLPGEGTQMLSRIHVEDLAAFALAAAQLGHSETFVIGDAEPAPHIEVVRFICESYGCALPASLPLESVHASLRADRAVDSARARARLGVRLRYPSYRQGMAPDATGLAPASAP